MIIQPPLITTSCVNRFHQSRTGRLTKNTAYILCNRSISPLILHKWLSTNSGHYISMVKIGDIWFECNYFKVTKIEFNNLCNSNTVYMLLCTMETFKGHWAGPNGCRLLSKLRRRHQNSTHNRFLMKTSFHYLFSFTFVTFWIHWSLFSAASSVSWCWSCFVCSGLKYEIYCDSGPQYTYIAWFVIMW